MILAIDPGVSGALVLMNTAAVFEYSYMPIVPKPHGRGNQVDAYGVDALIRQWRQEHKIQGCKIERVGARPNQGVTGMFSFGRSVGILEGIMASYAIPVHFVLPINWKRRAGILKAEKDAARGVATQLYPSMAEVLKTKKSIAIADAILIGRYG